MAQNVEDNLFLYVRAGSVSPLRNSQNNVMSPTKDTILHLEAAEGLFDSFKVNCSRRPDLLHRLDGKGYTPLHVAVNNRQYEIVKLLTTTEFEKEDSREEEEEKKKVPNKRLLRMLSSTGETALSRAVYLEYIEMVVLLTEADPEFRHPGDWSKQTPLQKALTAGSSNILEVLLKACPASALGGMLTLAKGARQVLKRETADYAKRINCLKVIYRRYPSLAFHKYKWEETTLHRAARNGQVEIIKCLLHAFSKPLYHDKEETKYTKKEEEEEERTYEKLVRMVNKDKDTALHLAVKGKQLCVVKLLTETMTAKKLVLMTNEDMDTPLHSAVRSDLLEISKLLLKAYPHKELVMKADRNENNALHLAIGTGNLELVKLLTKADLNNELVMMGDKNMNAEDIDKDLITTVNKEKHTALHLAVESQQLEMVKFLSGGEHGKVLLRMGDKNSNTALHLAVKRHNTSIVRLLLTDPEQKKELVRMVNEDKETALHLAVRNQLLEVVKLLIEAEPDKDFLRMVNKKKDTALHLAIEYKFIELVKLLIEEDSDDKELLRMGNRNKNTALHLAIKGNNVDAVEYVLNQASFDKKILRLVTMDRNSLLHLAVRQHSLEFVKLLIDADSNKELVRMADKNLNTALHLAVKYEHLEMVKLLIAADTDDMLLVKMGDKDKNTALHLAVKIYNPEIVECLTQIANSGNKLVRMVNKDKDTALHLAVQDSLAEVVPLLTSADPEYKYAPNNAGVTPLYMAVEKGSDDIVEKILEACPSSAYGGPNGDTALQRNMVQGNPDIRKLLLRTQPDQCKVKIGENGRTSLHYAAFNGDINAVKDIIQSYPSCSALVDNDGRNFLHLAAMNKHIDIVNLALQSKEEVSVAVLNQQDDDGHTPLHTAAKTGNKNLVLPLLLDERVNRLTENLKGEKAVDAIIFEYDKEKFGIRGVRDKINEKELKEQRAFDLVVNALIATLSFTAGITVPGGYIDDGPNRGRAILCKNKWFQVFLICNAFALLCSLTAAFSHFCTRLLLKRKDILFHGTLATYCTLCAIFATMVSFIAGSFAVLGSSNHIAIVVSIMCSSFFIIVFYATWRIVMEYKQPAH